MSQNRIPGLSGKSPFDDNASAGSQDLSGFSLNPIWSAVTPEQMLLYQTAYHQAVKSVNESNSSHWPLAENWN